MSKKNIPTRSKTFCSLFGHGKELRQTVLPTYEDLIKHYLLVQSKLKQERAGQQPSISEVAEIVALQLEQNWHKIKMSTDPIHICL